MVSVDRPPEAAPPPAGRRASALLDRRRKVLNHGASTTYALLECGVKLIQLDPLSVIFSNCLIVSRCCLCIFYSSSTGYTVWRSGFPPKLIHFMFAMLVLVNWAQKSLIFNLSFARLGARCGSLLDHWLLLRFAEAAERFTQHHYVSCVGDFVLAYFGSSRPLARRSRPEMFFI